MEVPNTPAQLFEERLFDSFLFELQIFDKILYKNKNQHRRGIYFRKLLEIRRCGQLLSTIFPVLSKMVNSDWIELSTLEQFITILWRMLGSCLKCSRLLLEMLGQSYFMTMSLALIACISRFYVCLRPLLFNCVKLWRQLSDIHNSSMDQLELFLSSGPIALEYSTLTSKLALDLTTIDAERNPNIDPVVVQCESPGVKSTTSYLMSDTIDDVNEMSSVDMEALLRLSKSSESIDLRFDHKYLPDCSIEPCENVTGIEPFEMTAPDSCEASSLPVYESSTDRLLCNHELLDSSGIEPSSEKFSSLTEHFPLNTLSSSQKKRKEISHVPLDASVSKRPRLYPLDRPHTVSTHFILLSMARHHKLTSLPRIMR